MPEVPPTESPQPESLQPELPQTELPQTEPAKTEAPQTIGVQAVAPATESAPTPPPQIIERNISKHYLIKWKLLMNLQINGMERNFYGWLGDISTTDATAYIENNLPINTKLKAAFIIPPKYAHGPTITLQANCKSTYCVLGNNGMFRAGIKFLNFENNGQDALEKELLNHIPHG